MTGEDRNTPRLRSTPLVIAPDVILDLVLGRGRGAWEAEALFEAIAADVEAGATGREAWISPSTIPIVHHMAGGSRDRANAASTVVSDLLRLVRVAPLGNVDYHEALMLRIEYEAALQFVTFRRVGASFLVTRESFGMKRTPVPRRSPAEVLPLFRRTRD